MNDFDAGPALRRLLEIMATLRSPAGCPWDAVQTPESLRPYLLEETYEVLEAIDSGNTVAIREELGDLLLQIVFLTRIFEEKGDFTMKEVADSIAEKLVRRHPHVFGEESCADPAALDAQWERIKAQEKTTDEGPLPVFAGIPRELPALQRATKTAEKAYRAGMTAVGREPRVSPVEQGVRALEAAIRQENRPAMEECLGQLLFSIANLGRTLGVDAEQSLRRTLDRMTQRIEDGLGRAGEREKMSPSDLDDLWRRVINLSSVR